mgnify:CR=1 FL=1
MNKHNIPRSGEGEAIRIVFASLKHDTAGKHSSFMPLAIGFIAAYVQERLGREEVEVKLLESADGVFEAIDNWRPHILAMSHYCWNAELNYLVMREAKKRAPDIVTVAGGPEFPEMELSEECHQLLFEHQEIDLFAYGEGEFAFAEILEKLRDGMDITDLKKEPQLGMMSIHPVTGELISGPRSDRLKQMDEFPSPYLSGVMDVFFDGEHAPMVQLARGCPYHCTFCNAAQSWYSRVGNFSMERVQEELAYIAERVKDQPHLVLAITDSNFGMFQRDVEIAEYIRGLQDKYNWPQAFDFTTGKSHYDRIMKVNELLRNKFKILVALQSMNEETLKVIKRKNLTFDQFRDLIGKIKDAGMQTATDLIIPLPAETSESFIDAMRLASEEGVDLIVPNTLCLLKGTALASPETRQKYEMVTKWRMVARQNGVYADQICFEVEEVCIQTNSMTFEEYLECRSIGFLSVLYSDPQFDILHRHVKELGFKKFDMVEEIWRRSKNGKTAISEILQEYVRQSERELFETPEEVVKYYTSPENYERVKTGEIGDNLIRRFRGMVFMDRAAAALDIGYDVLEDMGKNILSAEEISGLRAARTWARAIRSVGDVFRRNRLKVGSGNELHLDFDVASWYASIGSGRALSSYKAKTQYKLSIDWPHVDSIMDTAVNMYGEDLSLAVPRVLEYYPISAFWQKSEPVGHQIVAGE